MNTTDNKGNSLDMIRAAIEITQPDLRHYYRMTKKARVVAVYASDGTYFADVQPLRNDETPDAKEPVVPRVAIPVMWGGPNRGVVCPPVVGVLCDLSYYDGDPNWPFISNMRWDAGNPAPAAELNEFVIQLEPGVEIRIDKAKQVVTLTPQNVNTKAGKSWTVEAGENASIKAGQNAVIEAGHNASIEAGAVLTLKAPLIVKEGNETSSGAGGGMGTAQERDHRQHEGSYSLQGPATFNGNVVISGTLTVGGGINGKVNGCTGC